MIPQAVNNYCSALSHQIYSSKPLTVIGEVGGANKAAKLVQVFLKIVRHCVKEGMLEVAPETFSGVKKGLRYVEAARDYMSFCNGLNKSSSSSQEIQHAWKVLKEGSEDQIEYWIIVAAGVGSVAFIGMYVGGKPFLILHKHMGINTFGMVKAVAITYNGLSTVSSLSTIAEKTLKIYQLNQQDLSTEKYYQKLVPHSVKLASKFTLLVSKCACCSPGFSLGLLTFSAITNYLSALVKSSQDKKE